MSKINIFVKNPIFRQFFYILAVSSGKCTSDLSQHSDQIESLKSSIQVYGNDLFESQTESDKKLEEMESSISSMVSKVNDFSRSQKTLSSYVNNFKQDVEISIAGYLTHFTQYIGKFPVILRFILFFKYFKYCIWLPIWCVFF